MKRRNGMVFLRLLLFVFCLVLQPADSCSSASLFCNDEKTFNEWSEPHTNATPVNSPSPAAFSAAAVYVRYKNDTGKEERDEQERVLLFGGWEHINPYVSFAKRDRGSWIYTPSENSWFHLPSEGRQPPDRFGHSLSTLCRDRVVLFGGILNSNLSHRDPWTSEKVEARPLNNLWVFDGVQEIWQEVKTSDIRPPGRAFHSATVVTFEDNGFYCNQSLFIFGGMCRFHLPRSPCSACILQDLWELKLIKSGQGCRGVLERWKQYRQKNSPKWPSERFFHTTVSTNNGTMLMFGGRNCVEGDGNGAGKHFELVGEKFVWSFNVSSSTWTELHLEYPSNPIHIARGAIAFDSTTRKLFQVHNGSVYTFSEKALIWTDELKTVGASVRTDLANFAAVVVKSSILLFAGMEPHTTLLTMRVWNIEMTNDSWVWQLRSAPRKSPPLQALASWFVIGDRLVFCGSASHEWSKFMLDKWSKLQKLLSDFTKKAIKIDIHNNQRIHQRIKDVSEHFHNMHIGLTTESNSVWHMDLKTKVWWQYSTASGNRPLFYTTSAAMDHKLGEMLVTYGGAAASDYKDGQTDFSLAFNRSDVFVYLLKRRQWKRTVVKANSQGGPGSRVFSSLVDTGDGESMVLFGGAKLNVDTFNELINRSRSGDIGFSDYKEFGKMTSDVWKLTIRSSTPRNNTDCDFDLEIEWTLLTNETTSQPAPEGRVGHASLILQDKIAILGGMQLSLFKFLSPSEFFTCLEDIWIFDLSLRIWNKYGQKSASKASICWTQRELCRPAAAGVGTRIITTFHSDRHCKKPYLQSFMVNATDSKCWQNHTKETLPFRPEFLFSWNNRIVAVNQELVYDNDVQEQGAELELNLNYQDNVYVSEMTPGCEAGHWSPDWTTIPCQECPPGSFAGAGAKTCFPCPDGLSTFDIPASSIDKCLCDPSYCVYGLCFVAKTNSNEQRKAECQCNIGFMGRKCDQPTYFIIAAVSLVALVIVVVSVLLLKQMIKYRKQKIVREIELEEMRSVWTIDSSEIQLLERIDNGAPGSYGDVYMARYRDIRVALKKLKLQTREFERDFLKETELMKSMRHPNIVLFIGAGKFDFNDCPFLVLEYMQNGALTGILRKQDVEISRKQQFMFCLDAAKGMEFLHSQRPARIHRDLKSNNLLVSAGWMVKVADFGCARLVKRQGARQSVAKRRNITSAPLNNTREPLLQADRDLSEDVGAALWRAPEVFAGEPYGTPVDVYSFGIVMWEIVARDVPYIEREFQWMKDVSNAVLAGVRPCSLEGIDRSYGDLMRECWARDPSLRPSFVEVVQRLGRLLQTDLENTER